MGQSVWHCDTLGDMAQASLNMAIAASDNASSEFVRGAFVAMSVLCQQVGAPMPRLPERRIEIVEVVA